MLKWMYINYIIISYSKYYLTVITTAQVKAVVKYLMEGIHHEKIFKIIINSI